MTELGISHEREDLGGGQFRLTQHLRPIAYLRDGLYRLNNNEFVTSGIEGREHIVSDATLMVSSGSGTRRIHPTHEEDVYLEIGRPYNVSTRQPYPLNSFTRSGNLLTSVNSTANIYIWHGGHFSKLGIELKGTWKTSPPAQVAFPVALSGLTWNAGTLYKDGVAVMQLSAPVAYDMDNEFNRRAMTWDFVQLAGQWYVVLDLPTAAQMSGWSRPLIDPTLTLQPDGTEGKDAVITARAGLANTNLGTNTINIGEPNTTTDGSDRSLFQFNLSSIPSTAVVSAATFSLFFTDELSSTNRVARLYRLRSGRDWVENQVTWNSYKTSNLWDTAGCGNTTTDREATDFGSCTLINGSAANTRFDFSCTPSVVQEWISGSFTNNGFIAIADTEIDDWFRFGSSDTAIAARRPILEVVYATGKPAHMQYYRRLRV